MGRLVFLFSSLQEAIHFLLAQIYVREQPTAETEDCKNNSFFLKTTNALAFQSVLNKLYVEQAKENI